MVFKQNSRSDSFEGFDLGKDRVSGTDNFRFQISSASGQSIEIRSATSVALGVWYHVAAVRGSNFTQLYVNGQLESQTNVSFAQDYGTLPVYFGSSGQPYWDHKLQGLLDEVSIYNRALSPSEISGIYLAGAAGKCGGPVITSQPQSLTVVAGTNAVFSVSASGNLPINYQWQLNGAALPNATDATLNIIGVQPANAGNYSVKLGNSFGTTTSAVALLTVLAPPTFTTQPASRTNLPNTTASFNAAVTGTSPLAYQWQANGIPLSNNSRITGVTTTNLVLQNVQPIDAGAYSLLASNAAGLATSYPAVLTVSVPPVITAQPTNLNVLVGSSVAFYVSASAPGALAFNWQRNGGFLDDGGNVSGATSSALSLSNVQTNDSAAYRVILANNSGAVTSDVAVLTVTRTAVAPTITLEPLSQIGPPGGNVTFTSAAAGTGPLFWQWRANGTNLSDSGRMRGATGPTLTIQNLVSSDAGDYQSIVSNSAGATASMLSSLSVIAPAKIGADALVLVNSSSGRFLDFQHYIQPYLDNFGIAYAVRDIATNGVGTNLAQYALIVVGHQQLDIDHLYLGNIEQSALSTAVSNGIGLVSFDGDLWEGGGTPRYQFEQDIFGFGYAAAFAGNNASFPPTEPGSQMHYISALHQTNEAMALSNAMTVAGLTLPAGDSAVVLSGGRPFVAVTKFGQGRAVQWASYDWISTSVQGPVNGLDDLVWRSMVWAARKPFVMRGIPNMVTLRVDDVEGPLWWAHMANDAGFKPFIAVFISPMSDADAADLRGMVTNGNATASVHSFAGSTFFYWNHAGLTNWVDVTMSNNFFIGTQWHANHGIPISKIVIAHYSEMGANSYPWLKTWGVEYTTLKNEIGTARDSPWLVAAPYRLYEPRQPGSTLLPVFYADFISVPGHPELDGQFFNCATEIRDAVNAGEWNCGEWCPDNNVAGVVAKATRTYRRGFDSQVLSTLYTHEWYIHLTSCCGATPITPDNWRAILSGITNNLAPYQPQYVTMDYAYQYVRATRTSRVTSSQYDTVSGQVSVSLAGKTDLETSVKIFVGSDSSITNIVATVPVFSNSVTVTASASGAAPPPARVTSIALLPDRNIGLSVTGAPNYLYQINASTNLNDWSVLTYLQNTNGAFRFNDLNATNFQKRFYRAIWAP
jgi:hypothetical protein